MMELTHITLQGIMAGPIWWPAGKVREIEFCKDFAAPGSYSPWWINWTNLGEAIREALDCGDFQGGMGGLVCGSIIFHMTDKNRRVKVMKPLEILHPAQQYLV